jgi:hypothetical protein
VAPEWTTSNPSDLGEPRGRPFLTQSAYYVPFERKLLRIDPVTGKVEQPWDWPNTEKDTPGKPGNLLVTSEQVIVVNDTEVAGYSKWETARDNRLARIHTAPNDPEPYLALAEISFRTDHQPLAQENMKKSVDLTNAADAAGTPVGGTGGDGSRPASDMLRRLYRTNLNFAEQLLTKEDTAQRDQARFYYEQCRASARDPEQQSEWRIRFAELSLKQKKPDEAAGFYSEILADPALRVASYRENDVLASAGSTAEQRLRKLISDNGPALYERFEDQATALLQKARAQRDNAAFQQVVDAYPNSKASVAAATDLAAAYVDKRDWENARRTLWWLEPRVQGEAQARAIADLVTVCVGLKKYPSASAWASRGLRQFKDLSFFSSTGEKITFEDVRKKIDASGAADADNRLPAWYGVSTQPPPMDSTPLDSANVLPGRLLAPIETALSLRRPDLLFLQKGRQLQIYNTATGAKIGDPIQLPQDQPAALLGVVDDTAILLQRDRAVGVDLKTHTSWVRPISRGPGAVNNPSGNLQVGGARRLIINGVQQQVIINNGNAIIVQPDGTVVDSEGNVVNRISDASDPEVLRRSAIVSLGTPTFSTARIIGDRLYILSGTQLTAVDAHTGQSPWPNRSVVGLPAGNTVALAANEDVVVAQVDAPNGNSTTFYVLDADAGKFRKQFRIDNERVNWRAVGDDGTLYVVTDQAVAAYDLLGDQPRSLWRRSDIQTRYAAATALTLDGLIVIDSNLNVQCLSTESGESRWPASVRLPLDPSGAPSVLRSMVDGDQVLFQANQSLVAIRSMFSEKGQILWRATYPYLAPPLNSMQLSDRYLIELASGPVNAGGRQSVMMIFRDRRMGKLDASPLLTRGPGVAEGPQVQTWQVLNGGIAFEVAGETHFWRNVEK